MSPKPHKTFGPLKLWKFSYSEMILCRIIVGPGVVGAGDGGQLLSPIVIQNIVAHYFTMGGDGGVFCLLIDCFKFTCCIIFLFFFFLLFFFL